MRTIVAELVDQDHIDYLEHLAWNQKPKLHPITQDNKERFVAKANLVLNSRYGSRIWLYNRQIDMREYGQPGRWGYSEQKTLEAQTEKQGVSIPFLPLKTVTKRKRSKRTVFQEEIFLALGIPDSYTGFYYQFRTGLYIRNVIFGLGGMEWVMRKWKK